MKEKLEKLRKEIDQIDDKILRNLVKRVKVVKKIGLLKKSEQLPALDKKRWQSLINNRLKKGEKLKISGKFVKKLFEVIHEYSLAIESS